MGRAGMVIVANRTGVRTSTTRVASSRPPDRPFLAVGVRMEGSSTRPKCENPEDDTDREIRARFDRQASATKQRPLPWSLPILMRKTVFFFVSFHRRAMQAWVLFLVSIERGTPMPDLSLPSLAV